MQPGSVRSVAICQKAYQVTQCGSYGNTMNGGAQLLPAATSE